MKQTFSKLVGFFLFSATVLAAPMALADDEDKAACVDLDEGDDCTRGDGDPGVCIPDESDPNVLTCDDDTLSSGGGGSNSGSGDGCSASGAASTGGGFALVGLVAALAIGGRRRYSNRA